MDQAMSTVSTDLYIGVRRLSHRKASAVDARTSNEIVICNILKFLDASPLSLFESSSPDAKKSDSFFEEIYESFVSCLVTANDTVRVLSQPVAEKILPKNGLLASVRQATPLDSEDFKLKFWKLMYVTKRPRLLVTASANDSWQVSCPIGHVREVLPTRRYLVYEIHTFISRVRLDASLLVQSELPFP
jgi:hypothetical protein